jgi:hypothetical protein
VAELLERLGVGRDERQVDVLPRIGDRLATPVELVELRQLGGDPARLVGTRGARGARHHAERTTRRSRPELREPRGEDPSTRRSVGEAGAALDPVDCHDVADAAVGHDHRAREPEGAAEPVEVKGEDEVGDQPRVAEAQPDRADQDRPRDDARHHLQQAPEPAVAIVVAVRHVPNRRPGGGLPPTERVAPPSRPM